uniref:Uncharacterized protein n=1 Tax=Candidatus Kentrum eta TaxID=2126337 RepID=A0A450UPC1_9GAMM|nr:MAG: hypothetical protein BECKH772A_GA0070896_100715 [Candidatus Kentron sp. H]VFJ95249.1 MAG: hypothetical protein BECKH772B_GA0070898_100745 [Candidatus Kentron sp. H]VFK01647.1 MAG: hypothetical protein BECKH772C_GA0070978_100705 [Candidatus Kentron sp. H]
MSRNWETPFSERKSVSASRQDRSGVGSCTHTGSSRNFVSPIRKRALLTLLAIAEEIDNEEIMESIEKLSGYVSKSKANP